MNQLPNHSNYNCKITAADGQTSMIYANWLHNQDQDHWQGWHCQAGTQRIHINKDLMVFSGECKNDFLGSALTNFEPLENGTICNRSTCTGCTDDLAVTKQKISAD
jgi:hypothetical protein